MTTKPREFWLAFTEDDRLSSAVLKEPFPSDFAEKLGMPFEEIHVREVLDPDPRDAALNRAREALEFYAQGWHYRVSENSSALEETPECTLDIGEHAIEALKEIDEILK